MKCEWPGHNAAMEEAGWCPVCDAGELDPEFAQRHGIDDTPDFHEVPDDELTPAQAAAVAKLRHPSRTGLHPVPGSDTMKP